MTRLQQSSMNPVLPVSVRHGNTPEGIRGAGLVGSPGGTTGTRLRLRDVAPAHPGRTTDPCDRAGAERAYAARHPAIANGRLRVSRVAARSSVRLGCLASAPAVAPGRAAFQRKPISTMAIGEADHARRPASPAVLVTSQPMPMPAKKPPTYCMPSNMPAAVAAAFAAEVHRGGARQHRVHHRDRRAS